MLNIKLKIKDLKIMLYCLSIPFFGWFNLYNLSSFSLFLSHSLLLLFSVDLQLIINQSLVGGGGRGERKERKRKRKRGRQIREHTLYFFCVCVCVCVCVCTWYGFFRNGPSVTIRNIRLKKDSKLLNSTE